MVPSDSDNPNWPWARGPPDEPTMTEFFGTTPVTYVGMGRDEFIERLDYDTEQLAGPLCVRSHPALAIRDVFRNHDSHYGALVVVKTVDLEERLTAARVLAEDEQRWVVPFLLPQEYVPIGITIRSTPERTVQTYLLRALKTSYGFWSRTPQRLEEVRTGGLRDILQSPGLDDTIRLLLEGIE